MKHSLLFFGAFGLFACSLLLSGCTTLSESILAEYDCKDLRKMSIGEGEKIPWAIRPSSKQINAEYDARGCSAFEGNNK